MSVCYLFHLFSSLMWAILSVAIISSFQLPFADCFARSSPYHPLCRCSQQGIMQARVTQIVYSYKARQGVRAASARFSTSPYWSSSAHCQWRRISMFGRARPRECSPTRVLSM